MAGCAGADLPRCESTTARWSAPSTCRRSGGRLGCGRGSGGTRRRDARDRDDRQEPPVPVGLRRNRALRDLRRVQRCAIRRSDFSATDLGARLRCRADRGRGHRQGWKAPAGRGARLLRGGASAQLQAARGRPGGCVPSSAADGYRSLRRPGFPGPRHRRSGLRAVVTGLGHGGSRVPGPRTAFVDPTPALPRRRDQDHRRAVRADRRSSSGSSRLTPHRLRGLAHPAGIHDGRFDAWISVHRRRTSPVSLRPRGAGNCAPGGRVPPRREDRVLSEAAAGAPALS